MGDPPPSLASLISGRDITQGTEGVIEGWADPEMRLVLLKVVVKTGAKAKEVVQSCYPRNLQLTSEYDLSKAGASGSATEPSQDQSEEPGAGSQKKGQWAFLDSPPENVQFEKKWTSLQADGDNLTKAMFRKGRMSTSLEALTEALPKFAEKDLVIVQRKSDKGLWKCEVWTKRDFEPMEILLGPV